MPLPEIFTIYPFHTSNFPLVFPTFLPLPVFLLSFFSMNFPLIRTVLYPLHPSDAPMSSILQTGNKKKLAKIQPAGGAKEIKLRRMCGVTDILVSAEKSSG